MIQDQEKSGEHFATLMPIPIPTDNPSPENEDKSESEDESEAQGLWFFYLIRCGLGLSDQDAVSLDRVGSKMSLKHIYARLDVSL